MFQVLHMSIEMACTAKNDNGINHMFRNAFVNKKPIIPYRNGESFIQKDLDTRRFDFSVARAMSQPTPLEVQILFHLLVFPKIFIENGLRVLVHSYIAGVCIGFAVQHVPVDWGCGTK